MSIFIAKNGVLLFPAKAEQAVKIRIIGGKKTMK